MASDVLVGLTIGAAASGSVMSALGSTERALKGLDTATHKLGRQQQRLGRVVKRSQQRGLVGLRRQQAYYDKVTRAVNRTRRAQIKLTAAAGRSQAALERSQQRWGKLMATAVAAYGVFKSATATAGQAAGFQDNLRDLRITAHLSAKDEARLGKLVRQASLDTNQNRATLVAGTKALIQGGAGVDKAMAEMPVLGDTMTALRTSLEQTAGVMRVLRDQGFSGEKGMRAGISKIIAISQQGPLSADQMVGKIGELTDAIRGAGLHDKRIPGQIAASLQVGYKALGNEVTGAMQGFLENMNTSTITAAYKSQGIDYQARLLKKQQQGMTRFQAAISVAKNFLRQRLTPEQRQQLQAGNVSDQLKATLDQAGITSIFGEPKTARLVLSLANNANEVGQLSETQGDHQLAATKALRMQSPIEQLDHLKNQVIDMGLTIGNVLLPPLLELANAFQPVVQSVSDFAKANPAVIKTVAGLAAGLVGMRIALLAGGFAISSIMVPFTKLRETVSTVNAAVALGRAKWVLWQPAMKQVSLRMAGASKQAAGLAGVLGGKLLSALKVAGRAVLVMGRALLMNPIGLVVAAVAGGALLIYKYWAPIKGFFAGVWAGLKEGFAPLIEALKPMLSALGDAFGGVMGVVRSLMPVLGVVFAPLLGPLKVVVSSVKTLFGWLQNLLTPVKAADGAARSLGQAFGKGLAKAVIWVGKLVVGIATLPLRMVRIGADMMGRLIEGIGSMIGAVGGVVGDIWGAIKATFGNGMAGIGKLLLDWSPLGLLYRALSAGLGKLGVDLPAKFSDLGGMLVKGLIGGIANMGGAVKDAIAGLGGSVVGWFKDKLGIHSPSRVFEALGGFVSEGAAVGIRGKQGLVRAAVGDLAAHTGVALPAPRLAPANEPIAAPPVAAVAGAATGSPGGKADMTVTFAPTIQVTGGGNVRDQVNQALTLSFEEFQRLMQQYQHRARRSQYGSIG